MGSDSDWPTMKAAAEALEEFGVGFEADVVSAHRMPEEMLAYGKDAAGRGLQVIIAGAGGAAHLPGMLAAVTPLPVIGVPVALKYLDGMDSLLSIVQMPAGVPGRDGRRRQRAQRRPARRPHPGRVRRGAARRRWWTSRRRCATAPRRRARPSAARRDRSHRLLAGSVRAPARCARRRTPAGRRSRRRSPRAACRGRARPTVSMRASTGASPAWARCSAAVNLKLCAGTTRSSWSPVMHQRRGVRRALADVVQRRVGQQRLEHLRVLGGAEVGDPRRRRW